MKGISEVIATLLMLIIAVALAGTAYMYISGHFKARTAVVLNLDPAFSYCNVTHVVVGVRNDGMSPASGITVAVYKPDGSFMKSLSNVNVSAGNTTTVEIDRTSGDPAGYHRIVISHPSSTAEGVIYCAQSS